MLLDAMGIDIYSFYFITPFNSSYREGNVGFLDDERRMNVALTRPRRGLIIVGDEHTLTVTKTIWAKWLAWAKQNSFYRDWIQGHDRVVSTFL